MVLGSIADTIARGVENATARTSSALFEPVIRLGVTGLSRAGKTVFITSLVANLLDRQRMPQLLGAANGTIKAVLLQPQPDDTIPRFDYENHLAALTGTTPHWPQSTQAVRQLRLSIKIQPSGILAGMRRVRTLHLDIVDYPGEWLLDLPLMDQSYREWSEEVLNQSRSKGRASIAENWVGMAEATDPSQRFEEPTAQALAKKFTDYLVASRKAGFSACAPGRFLLPGEMEGSPALTFAPLSLPEKTPRGSLGREMERRFEAYKSHVIKPFFRDHFSRIDRQIVLVDVMGAISAGPQAVEDMKKAMLSVLRAFRPGRNSWLSLLVGKKVERILFAATKADHLHHSQHSKLTSITEALLKEAEQKADYAGAATTAMSIASLRCTVEDELDHNGRHLKCVRGILAETGKPAAMYPGELPNDPGEIIRTARNNGSEWLNADYKVMRFLPAASRGGNRNGLPHIRLDKALEFLIGDQLL